MNFFNIIKKGTNTQLESLKDSAIYDIAAEKLEPKPYATQAKPLFLLSKYFSAAYHFISYIVALIGITLYALQLDSLVYQIILILLSFILLFVVEIAKGNASNTVFAAKARKEQPNQLFLAILVITTIFSFCTSVWSAKEAVYFASTNTKFINIDSLQNSQIDSINNLFAIQVSSTESSIRATQETLDKTKNKWLRISANKDLKESQNMLTDILEKKEKALLSISKNTKTSKDTTDTNGLFIAKLAAVIFLLFESLNLIAYWFLYQYYSNVLLEQNLLFEGITKTVTTAVQDTKNTITSAVQNVSNSVPNYSTTTAVTPNVTATVSSVLDGVQNSVPNVPKEPNKIGFITAIVPKKESEITAAVPNGNGNKICLYENCKKVYTYKIHNQKFCSENCRIENYKLKNNKTFFKGKGGKNA